MDIKLKPETEASREWLSENRQEILEKIEAGYASARRGDLLDAEEVRTRMAERKQAWVGKQRPRE